MIRKTLIATAVLTVASGAVYAQPAGPQLSAPELGFIYDASAQNIRKISGVPGAASLDGAVALDVTFTSAWVHSASQTAVGIAKSGEITGAGWSGEAPVAAALESNLDGLTLASFSRSGGFVVLSDGESVELWTGIGGEAALADAFSPAGGVLAVAVNNAGTVAVATGAGQIVVSAGDSSVVAASGSGDAAADLVEPWPPAALDSRHWHSFPAEKIWSPPTADNWCGFMMPPPAPAVWCWLMWAELSGPWRSRWTGKRWPLPLDKALP